MTSSSHVILRRNIIAVVICALCAILLNVSCTSSPHSTSEQIKTQSDKEVSERFDVPGLEFEVVRARVFDPEHPYSVDRVAIQRVGEEDLLCVMGEPGIALLSRDGAVKHEITTFPHTFDPDAPMVQDTLAARGKTRHCLFFYLTERFLLCT